MLLSTFIRIILLSTFLISSQLSAEDIQINGFLAQGIIQTQDANFVNDDGDVSFKLTELGINSSYRISPNFRLAGQAVYLDGGNRYQKGLRVDYLFLDWQLYNSPTWQLKAQVGRNKNYHWLYSSTRDVPHTRPTIVLPQSIYFDVFRDVAIGVDGMALLAQIYNNLGEWDVNLSLGNSPISEEQTKNLLGKNASGKLTHDTDIQFSIYWRPSLSNIQLSVTLLDADFSYQAGQNDVFLNGNETSQRFMFSFLYQSENYEIALEMMRERMMVNNLVFQGFKSDIAAEGGFLQGKYFLSPNITLLSRIDIYDRDRKNRDGYNVATLSQGVVPNYFGFMDQGTLGLTWQLTKNIKIQAEYHKTKGTGRLAPIFTPDILKNDSKYWDLWAVQLMYWF